MIAGTASAIVAPVEGATATKASGKESTDGAFAAALASAGEHAAATSEDGAPDAEASTLADAEFATSTDALALAPSAAEGVGPASNGAVSPELPRERSVAELELGAAIPRDPSAPTDAAAATTLEVDMYPPIQTEARNVAPGVVAPRTEPSQDHEFEREFADELATTDDERAEPATSPIPTVLAEPELRLDHARDGNAADVDNSDVRPDEGQPATGPSPREPTGIAAYRRASGAPLEVHTATAALASAPVPAPVADLASTAPSQRVDDATSSAPKPVAAAAASHEPRASVGTESKTVPLASAPTPEPSLGGLEPTLAPVEPSTSAPPELSTTTRSATSASANTPPAAAPSSHAAVTLERIEDLATAIERMRPIPRGGAVIEVQAPGFGPMRVEVKLEDGAVRVRIDSDDPRTAAWIEGEQRGLTAAARQAAPEASSVELELRQGHGDARERPSQRAHADERATPRSPSAPPSVPTAQPERPIANARRGLVDVLA